MALYNDRRQGGRIHDIGMNAAPTHDPAQGLAGWASAAHDVAIGRAAVTQRPALRSSTVLPGQVNNMGGVARPRNPLAPAPSPFAQTPRPIGRTDAWHAGSTPTSQTLPAGARAPRPATTQLPGFGKPIAAGPSYVQRTARNLRRPLGTR